MGNATIYVGIHPQEIIFNLNTGVCLPSFLGVVKCQMFMFCVECSSYTVTHSLWLQ